MQTVEPTTRKWTREEYYQMGDLGFFQDQRVELIDGEIIEMAPQKDMHAAAVGLVRAAVEPLFRSGFWIREQLPMNMGPTSEPEPDISVVPGGPRDYVGTGHPRTAALLVEVSETTLRFDRRRKGSLYAAAGIQDYWIVNLIDRHVEIHRQPIADASQPHGFRYADVVPLKPGQSMSPLAAAGQQVAVNDLLP